MSATRIEKDSMGEMPVPADALYGASTARAVANFPIANRPLPPAVIHAFGHLKAACAQANNADSQSRPAQYCVFQLFSSLQISGPVGVFPVGSSDHP